MPHNCRIPSQVQRSCTWLNMDVVNMDIVNMDIVNMDIVNMDIVNMGNRKQCWPMVTQKSVPDDPKVAYTRLWCPWD